MNQRNQCFILWTCVTLLMQSRDCASNNCGSIDLSFNGIIYTTCRLCADYSFKGYSHDTGMTYSGTSSFNLHIFLCICLHDTETTFCSRTLSHFGMSSFRFSFRMIRHFVLVLRKLKTIFENHASVNALG